MIEKFAKYVQDHRFIYTTIKKLPSDIIHVYAHFCVYTYYKCALTHIHTYMHTHINAHTYRSKHVFITVFLYNSAERKFRNSSLQKLGSTDHANNFVHQIICSFKFQ